MSLERKQENQIGKMRKIGFLLQPNFTMLALSSAIEPLRMANQLSGQILYEWTTVSENGGSVTASDGLNISVDCSIADVPQFDILIVCGGVGIKHTVTKTSLNWLTHLARTKVMLGSICTGSYLLAKASLLDGYNCTIHWELLASWQEEFPFINSSNQLYMLDRDRLTCSGGTAPIDMMLQVIGKSHGKELMAAISDMFTHEHIRDDSSLQRIPLQHIVGATQSKLQDVVSLMEANLEEVLGLDELADYVHLSRRQLERLFQKYLHCSPYRYYLQLRLLRARQLLKQTNMSIIEVAIACGFVSTPHFSKCYRNSFKIPPRDERNFQHNAAIPAAGETSFGMTNIYEHN